MSRVARGLKALTIGLPPDLYERLAGLAYELGRSVQAEVICAVERHLEARPVLRAPTMRPLVVEAAPARPASAPSKKPARPQKPAERRTSAREALAELDADAGVRHVSTREEQPSYNADPS